MDEKTLTRTNCEDGSIEIGEWYWVSDGKEPEWLGCVVRLGTNYAELSGAYYEDRIHFDVFDDKCRHEPDWRDVIRSEIDYHQSCMNETIDEVKRLAAELGTPIVGLPGDDSNSESTSRSLAVLSEVFDPKKYQQQLTTAKDKTLPELFDEIREASEHLGRWMKAESIPLEAEGTRLRGVLEVVDERIFSVDLYAGLLENVVQVSDGCPADHDSPLHVMQRMHYMDEECVAGYSIGGIDIESLDEFDRWISREENCSRLLPLQRCIIAFRVRRKEKIRGPENSLFEAFVNIRLQAADLKTFLYIRNGTKLYRMNTGVEFGSKLFPDEGEFDVGCDYWAKMFGRSVEKVIPDREYQQILSEYTDRRRKHEEWVSENPGTHRFRSPYYPDTFYPSEWGRFDSGNIYYDDIKKYMDDQIRDYNRIALIVQGLFDRSEVLHPHPPVRLWHQDSFSRHVRLVRDHDRALYSGDKPDFMAYWNECNESLAEGVATVGQEDFWHRREAERENRRLDNDWRYSQSYRHERFIPMGDPGPGMIARIKRWQPRARKATYRWTRESRSWDSLRSGIAAKVVVPDEELFNVEAYKPGDYKKFYNDPRTRQEYLQWAGWLLAAEEFHAGNKDFQPTE